MNLLLLNNFYRVSRVQKESDGFLYTVWSLVMVRNRSWPAQAIKIPQSWKFLP